jgi:hypothetical protein
MLSISSSRQTLHRVSLTALFTATLAACGAGGDEIANLSPPSTAPAPAPVAGVAPAPAPAPAPSTASAGDCLHNAVLLTAGTTYQQDLVFGQGTQSYETQSRFVVLGTGGFNGVSAVETQQDITILGALAASSAVAGRSFQYNNVVGNDLLQYGLKTTVTSSASGFATAVVYTTVYTPPIRIPVTARVGDVVTQTYAVQTTANTTFSGSATAGLPTIPVSITDSTETQVWKFVGIETISVAAGTFETCRLETTSTSTRNGTSSTTTATGWVVASGPVRGLLAKVSGANGQVLEAKVLRVN